MVNNHILFDLFAKRNEEMAVSLIYLSNDLMPTGFIMKRMKIALEKMLEKMAMKHPNTEVHEEGVV